MTDQDEKKFTRLASELFALTEIAKTLTAPLELPELLCAVLEKMHGVLEPAEAGVVMIWDQSAGLFRVAASYGFNFEILKEIGLRAGESITGKMYDAGQACLLATPQEVAQAMGDMRPANRSILERALGTASLPLCILAVPITANLERFGVLVWETYRGPARFSPEDLPFVQILADLVALTIDRARLEARADANREARHADRLRSEVLAALSHELRMPLSTIKGYATALLLDEVEWSEAKRSEFLHFIEAECDNMQGMLKDILDSSLIEVDQLQVERQPLRLQHLAHEIANEIQLHSEVHHAIVDFQPDFPLLEADPRWIKQVFRNIVDNAIKYSPDGGLVVIKGEARLTDVVISVSDQGLGISPEDLIPLFEKYFRVRSHHGLNVAGTGLGLPIARAIVEAHGGRIWAESKLGEGTTLFFSLPLPRFDLTEEC